MRFGGVARRLARAATAIAVVLVSAQGATAIDSKTVDSVVDRLSGHAGVVVPLAVFQGGDATTLADKFTIGIPVGIGLKIRPQLTFDMELVPLISDGKTSLLVHPGVIWNFSGPWSAGLRFAVNTDGEAWGFTPLLNRSLVELAEGVNLFAELDIPIRAVKDQDTLVGIATHFGVGF
jgi:hypothetical protein